MHTLQRRDWIQACESCTMLCDCSMTVSNLRRDRTLRKQGPISDKKCRFLGRCTGKRQVNRIVAIAHIVGHKSCKRSCKQRHSTRVNARSPNVKAKRKSCLLYTSDAADEEDSVDLG